MTSATPKCFGEVDIRLTGRDIWVIRLALDELMAIVTREEHIYHDIRAALGKLPEAHEPGGDDCACLATSNGRRASGEAPPGAEASRRAPVWPGGQFLTRKE